MASEGQKAASESPLRLAIEALHGRARALSEYYSVYRSGAGPRARGRRHQRVRELRHDIVRLQAWAGTCRWPIAGPGGGARYRLSGVFGRDRREQAGRRRHRRAGIQRLSSFSVVDWPAWRTWRTSRAACRPCSWPSKAGRTRARSASSGRKTPCASSPNTAAAWPKTPAVAVICWALARVLRVRGWLGLDRGEPCVVDS